METADTIHNFPVPERFLPLVTRTLAEAYAAEAGAEAGNISSPLEPPKEGVSEAGWTKEEVVRAYREATPALRAAFNYLADRPDEEVKTIELARAVYPNDTDMDARNRLYGVFGGFGSKAEYTYHKKKKDWFFSDYRERMPDGSAGRMIYVMPAEEAAWIREARGLE